MFCYFFFFFFQAEDGIRDHCVTGVQTCALPILRSHRIVEAGRALAERLKLGQLFEGCTVPHEVREDERETLPACRSEEHTSELQSHSDLVCRLLLEKKKKNAAQGQDTIASSGGE